MVPPTSASWQREPGSSTALGSCCHLTRSCSLSPWPAPATEAAPCWGSLFLALEDYPKGPGLQEGSCRHCFARAVDSGETAKVQQADFKVLKAECSELGTECLSYPGQPC